MLGTFVSVLSVSMLAVTSTGAELTVAASFTLIAATVASALVPALLMNISIVGLNQIYDVEIDKTNKPYLPIASGELSIENAWRVVCWTAILSLALGLATGSVPLLCTLAGSLVLGIAYSVDAPMLRWKRYPTVAAMCILSVRAVLVQFGFFFHMQRALLMGVGIGGLLLPTTATHASFASLYSSPALLFATAFMFVFSVVIALFKDIPDARGDKLNNMHTFTVRLGPKTVFWTCIFLLELAYGSGIVYSLLRLEGWARIGSAVAHALVGTLIFKRAAGTNVQSPDDVYGCYMDIWKAFYFEYVLIPLFGAL